MTIQKTTKIALFIVLIAVATPLCWGAASNPNSETPIGSLALLYAEGSADQAPRILALASLDRKNLLQLALIGYKEPQRFPNLYQDAMSELFNQKEKFKQFLQENNGDVQAALFDAVENNKPWAIDYLIQNGADVDAQDKYGNTALIKAADRGHEAIVARLITADADVNAKGNLGETALILAVIRGHEAVIAQLIAARADLNVKNGFGYTALMRAAMRGYEAVIAQLLAARADFNAKGIYDWTALMLAARDGHGAVVAQLIAAGAAIDTRDKGGNTALMLAAERGHEAVVAQLIAVGADVNAKNNGGNTALSLAERVVTDDRFDHYQAYRDRARAVVDLLTRGR